MASNPVTRHFATIERGRFGARQVHYRRAGSGPVVICFHQSPLSSRDMLATMERWKDRFTMIAPDTPGFGLSDPLGVTHAEMADFADAAIEFMDALGIEKAAIVGNSMGGVTAIRLAVVHPDRISHLITMGSGSTRAPKLFSAGDGPTEGLKVLQLCYREPTFENMKLLCEIMMFDPGDRVDALAQERLDSAVAHPEHLANFLDSLKKGGGPIRLWFTAEDLMAIKTPTLLFHGRDDRVVPYEHSLLLLAHIPNSRLHLFNRCGHWAMIEHPAEFNRDVIDFIQNN